MWIKKQIWRFDEITGCSQSLGPFMAHSVPSDKSRWFYMFGSAKYAKTTPAAEVAGYFG